MTNGAAPETVSHFKEGVGSDKVFEFRTGSFPSIYLNNTSPGEPIREALRQHTQDVLRKYRHLDGQLLDKRVVLLDIPRGGVPSAESAFD